MFKSKQIVIDLNIYFSYNSTFIKLKIKIMNYFKQKIKCMLILFAIVITFNVSAQLVMPSIFSDNMVLQRDAKIPVWGKASPMANVSVKFHGQERLVTADKEGNWKVYLSPVSVDNNPRKMLVASGGSKIIFKNILVGEVWLCSGQSNMKFELKTAIGAEKYISEARDSRIRFFQVDRYNFTP